MDPTAVFGRWRLLSESGVNNRAAAGRLGVSEAELLASGCGILSTRLVPDAVAILQAARRLGPAKFVLRNDYAVLERPGEIRHIETTRDGLLQVHAATFDLELAPGKVAGAFALLEHDARGAKRSLQLFDRAGITVLKLVFRRLPSGFEEALTGLSHPRQSRDEVVDPAPARGAPVSETCLEASLASFLHRAAALDVPLEIRVCNFGAWMRACSPVHRVKRSERAPWINVLDPELELHLYEDRIRGLRLERQSQNCGSLHWLADDGVCAFSARAARDFAALAAAAQ